ncbi:MAG: hypothetical protein QM757_28210 [Paludibaculum sp.]
MDRRDDHADGFREFNRKMNELRHVREGEETGLVLASVLQRF